MGPETRPDLPVRQPGRLDRGSTTGAFPSDEDAGLRGVIGEKKRVRGMSLEIRREGRS